MINSYWIKEATNPVNDNKQSHCKIDYSNPWTIFDTQIQEIKNNVIKFATKFDLYD